MWLYPQSKRWQILHQKDEYMSLEDFLDNQDDVLIRLQHDDGTNVTFLTATPEVFPNRERLEPLVFGMSDTDVYVAFNGDLLESMIKESVEKNAETYGAQAASFLPITMILDKGLKAVENYMDTNRSDTPKVISCESSEQKPNTDEETK